MTHDLFNIFIITVTPQSVLWKYIVKHFYKDMIGKDSVNKTILDVNDKTFIDQLLPILERFSESDIELIILRNLRNPDDPFICLIEFIIESSTFARIRTS